MNSNSPCSKGWHSSHFEIVEIAVRTRKDNEDLFLDRQRGDTGPA